MKMLRRLSIVTATAVTVTLSAPAVALAQAVPGTGPWGMHDGWFGWCPMGGLIWLLLIGLVIVGVVAIMRGFFSARKGESSGALKVLDERYARGEIDREEYLRRRKDIVG